MSPKIRFGGAAIIAGVCAGAFAAHWSPHHAKPPQYPQALSMRQTASAAKTAQSAYGRLPLSFELNQGQQDRHVKFLTRGAGYALFLTPERAVLALERTAGSRSESSHHTVVAMNLVGANKASRAEGLSKLPGRVNYFVGSNPRQWRTNIPTYSKVEFKSVYPGVDLVYYGRQQQLEHDFIVAAGSDPDRITLEFTGATSLSLNRQGDLTLRLDGGEVTLERPVIYQMRDGIRHEIAGGYVRKGSRQVGFKVAAYDATQPLVIDPVLTYSTYIHGTVGEGSNGIAVDSTGAAYVTGQTFSTDFPVTHDAYQTTPTGNSVLLFPEAFVAKLNPEGTALVYATYLGGSDEDMGLGIAVDGSGSAYVTGETSSLDFPVTAGALQMAFAGRPRDAFVTKLDRFGSALVYSTYLGGRALPGLDPTIAGDDVGQSLAVDSAGSVYVTGRTVSSTFPVTAGAFQTTSQDTTHLLSNTFVSKLNPDGTSVVYSTYLGGTADSRGNSIAVDASGAAYVAGETGGGAFPTTSGAFQTASSGGDAYVTKLNAAGTALVYSTYLGGSGVDHAGAIAVDAADVAYVAGTTASSNFPVTPGALQTAFAGGDSDAFASKLNATGTALVYSTYLGGTAAEDANGIAVDLTGFADVAGRTSSTNFPTTPDAAQPALSGSSDGFVIRIDPTGSAPDYSTYLGGSDAEVATAIAVDGTGSAYVTGTTFSRDFPVTAGAFQTTPSNTASFVSKFAATTSTSSLTALISQLLGDTCIDNSGVANALTTMVTDAQQAIADERTRAAGNILDALQHQVQAEAGKHISTSCTGHGVTFNSATKLLKEIQQLSESL